MKACVTGLIVSTIIVCCTMPLAAIEVTWTEDGENLVATILGPGMSILPGTISYQSFHVAAGAFIKGSSSGLDIDSGILLRTTGSGDEPGFGVLEFTFTSATTDMYCQYVLASEEYDDSGMPVVLYPDILKLYVDGENIALLPGTATPVSINTINAQNNPEYFYDNSQGVFSIEYSGFTRVLTAAAVYLEPEEKHHFKLLIMNEGDLSKNSAVFLGAGTLSSQVFPGITIDDVSADEDAGTTTFTVSLSETSTQPVSFSYTTTDVTATAGSDYTSVNGTLEILSGSLFTEITVNVLEDTFDEPDEIFLVELSNPINAMIADAWGIGTIIDNDGAPGEDACPDDPDKIKPGVCGCGVPDTDSDGDGLPDCIDGCPNDANKAAPGICGCGVSDTDTDRDGIADCNDNCPGTYNPDQADRDGDGIGDACEEWGGDVTISKTQDSGGTVAPGDIFSYTIIVQNHFENAVELMIFDALSGYVDYVAGSLEIYEDGYLMDVSESFVFINDKLTYRTDTLGYLESLVISFKVRVEDLIELGSIITNQAFVSVFDPGALQPFLVKESEIVETEVIPEPVTLALIGLGLFGLLAFVRRRRHRRK